MACNSVGEKCRVAGGQKMVVTRPACPTKQQADANPTV